MQDNMLGRNIIITERCRSLRQLGRNALRGKWKDAILAMIIVMVCIQVPQLIFDKLFGLNMANLFTNEGYTYGMDVEVYQQMYNSIPQSSFLSLIWGLLITGPMTLGATIFFLASFRGHNVVAKDVFLGFERFGKALWLWLYQMFFVTLWSLLFIIPGIIAAFRYSQAFFILADDPNKSIPQCVNESKIMMKGNKGKLFILGLSFIGWAILASIPGSILCAITSMMTNNTAPLIIANIIAMILTAPVCAYMMSTITGFYEILSGHLIKETAPMPVTVDQIEMNAPVEKIEEVIESVELGEMDQEAEAREAAEAAEDQHVLPEEEILPEPLDEEDKYHD